MQQSDFSHISDFSSFENRKSGILDLLSDSVNDKSPKGSVDEPIVELVQTVNKSNDYYTTSSCSGRISIFEHDPIKPKGGRWLLIEHGPIDKEKIDNVLNQITDEKYKNNETHSGLVVFRFEPFILSVACRNVSSASKLLSLAISAGYRESGIANLPLQAINNSNNNNNDTRSIMLSIRSSIRIEVSIALNHILLMDKGYFLHLVDEANRKWKKNCDKFNKFHHLFNQTFILNNNQGFHVVDEKSHAPNILNPQQNIASEANEARLHSFEKSIEAIETRLELLRNKILQYATNNGNTQYEFILNNYWPINSNQEWCLSADRNDVRLLVEACKNFDFNDRTRRSTPDPFDNTKQMLPITQKAATQLLNSVGTAEYLNITRISDKILSILNISNQITGTIQLRLVPSSTVSTSNVNQKANNSTLSLTTLSPQSTDPKRNMLTNFKKLLQSNEFCQLLKTHKVQNLDEFLQAELPQKWELLDDLLLLPQSSLQHKYWSSVSDSMRIELWKAIIQSFPTNRVNRLGKQSGIIAGDILRESRVELLLTDKRGGLVEHKENGIIYCFNVQQSMFSSGNVSEKQRITELVKISNNNQSEGQIVVDFYAGIGYWSLPILVHSKVKHYYALEWNPNSVKALEKSIQLNKVNSNRITVFSGDNRDPKLLPLLQNKADRLLLGLLPSSEDSWPLAINAVKPSGGILHVHANVQESKIDQWIISTIKKFEELLQLQNNTEKKQLKVKNLHLEKVKWFAPRIRHVVLDLLLEYQSNEQCSSIEETKQIYSNSTVTELRNFQQTNTNPIVVYNNPSREEFLNTIVKADRPAVIRGFHIGSKQLFSLNGLIDFTHSNSTLNDRIVSVHVCPDDAMDFVNKNYSFKTMKFGELMQRISITSNHATVINNNISHNTNDNMNMNVNSTTESKQQQDIINRDSYFISPSERYYLRSLGSNPRKEVSNFLTFFPELASYFQLPTMYLPADQTHFFSSVFRISSPNLSLWTHYDICSNLLCHLSGKKRVVFFPPSQVNNLYIPTAIDSSSSPVINIDQPDLQRFPLFSKALEHASSVFLEPGDILYIPSLWFHNVRALEFCTSINLFYRDLPLHYYEQKDLYGNRDLLIGKSTVDAATKIQQELINNTDLPEKYKQFYLNKAFTILQSDHQATSSKHSSNSSI